MLRFLPVVLILVAAILLSGCQRSHAIGTWQEDVKGGGQLLITIRADKTFSLLYSETGQYALVARIDGTYDNLGNDRLQLHPSGTNFVSGDPEAAAAAFGALHDFQNFAATGVFELMGTEVAQMPWGDETADMHRIQNSDIPPKLSQDEIEFSEKAYAEHQAILAGTSHIGKLDNIRANLQEQNYTQSQEPPVSQPYQTQPQPDPTPDTPPADNGRPADGSPGATPDPVPPDSVSPGDSTPPDQTKPGDSSTGGNPDGTSDQTSSTSQSDSTTSTTTGN